MVLTSQIPHKYRTNYIVKYVTSQISVPSIGGLFLCLAGHPASSCLSCWTLILSKSCVSSFKTSLTLVASLWDLKNAQYSNLATMSLYINKRVCFDISDLGVPPS